jgi:hypothetical protein
MLIRAVLVDLSLMPVSIFDSEDSLRVSHNLTGFGQLVVAPGWRQNCQPFIVIQRI